MLPEEIPLPGIATKAPDLCTSPDRPTVHVSNLFFLSSRTSLDCSLCKGNSTSRKVGFNQIVSSSASQCTSVSIEIHGSLPPQKKTKTSNKITRMGFLTKAHGSSNITHVCGIRIIVQGTFADREVL